MTEIAQKVSSLGDVLKGVLASRNLSVRDLSSRTGFQEHYLEQLIEGNAELFTETANEFERVLGVPAEVWESHERSYRATLP